MILPNSILAMKLSKTISLSEQISCLPQRMIQQRYKKMPLIPFHKRIVMSLLAQAMYSDSVTTG